MKNFAVIDCETTGFGALDRIIEIAVVVLDHSTLEVVDEFDTLVNPERDVGRTDIHGIAPKMLGGAPTFAEIASGLASRIDGSILVAHNLSFDQRMVAQECERLDITFTGGNGICTYRLSGSKLDVAALSLGIPLSNHHRAIVDARVTAAILKQLLEGADDCTPAHLQPPLETGLARTLRRESVGGAMSTSPLRRLLGRACYPSSESTAAAYFDMLDWGIADGSLSAEEKRAIESARAQLGLDSKQVIELHRAYLCSIESAIRRDGRVSEDEAKLFSRVSKMLGLGDASIEVTRANSNKTAIQPGCRVCFTGSATDDEGNPIERDVLEQLAAEGGLQPVSSVTKKACDLLVAQDPESLSGKAQKAIKWGIPVISVAEFLKKIRN